MTSSVTQTAGHPAGGVRARPKVLVVLVKTKAVDPGGDGLLQEDKSAGDVGVDEGPPVVRGDVRLVQGGGMDDSGDAPRANHGQRGGR